MDGDRENMLNKGLQESDWGDPGKCSEEYEKRQKL